MSAEDLTIVVSVADGRMAAHFGKAPQFALFEVDREKRTINDVRTLDAPPHRPGQLPHWLAARGANLVIAGGIGDRALDLFAEEGIEVIVGVPPGEPRRLVESYLEGTLPTGGNICDH